MKTNKIIEKRNADARKHLAIVENELLNAKLRVKAFADARANARTQGAQDRYERATTSLDAERRNIKDLEGMREKLLITLADQKYANQLMYTDIKPWEVIDEKTDKTIVVRSMRCTLKEEAAKALQESFSPGGFFGHTDNDLQEWDITPDEGGIVITLRKHRDGYWYEAGSCVPFALATEPRRRYDYNF